MHSAERTTMSDFDTVTVSDIPEGARILDVREDYEWVAGHAEGALHIPLDQLPARLDELDPGRGPLRHLPHRRPFLPRRPVAVRPGLLRPERGRRHGPVAGNRHAAGVRQRTQARHPVIEERSADARLTRHVHLPRTRGHLHRGGPDAGARCGGRGPRPVVERQHGAGQGPRRLGGRGDGADRELRGGRRHRHPGRDRHRTGTADPPRSPRADQLRAGGPARDRIEDIRRISTHGHAWAQCRLWVEKKHSGCGIHSGVLHRRGGHGAAGGRHPLRRRHLRPDRGDRAARPHRAGGEHRRQPRSGHALCAGRPARRAAGAHRRGQDHRGGARCRKTAPAP